MFEIWYEKQNIVFFHRCTWEPDFTHFEEDDLGPEFGNSWLFEGPWLLKPMRCDWSCHSGVIVVVRDVLSQAMPIQRFVQRHGIAWNSLSTNAWRVLDPSEIKTNRNKLMSIFAWSWLSWGYKAWTECCIDRISWLMWDLVQLNLLQHFTSLVPFLNGCNIATNFATLQRHGSSELEMTCTDLGGCAAAGSGRFGRCGSLHMLSHAYCFHIWCQAVIPWLYSFWI